VPPIETGAAGQVTGWPRYSDRAGNSNRRATTLPIAARDSIEAFLALKLGILITFSSQNMSVFIPILSL
jgi:hypothetical protein